MSDCAALFSTIAARLEDASREAREDAAQDLRGLPDSVPAEPIYEAIAPRLKHSRSEVREAAIRALESLVARGHPPTTAAAIRSSACDSSKAVRDAATKALGSLPITADRGAVALISELLQEKRWEVRAATLVAIGRLGCGKAALPDSISAVTQGLNDSSSEVRKSAVRVLGSLASATGDSGAIAALVAATAHEQFDVRKEAVPLLKRLEVQPNADTTRAVANLLKTDKSETRFAALFALRKFASRGDKVAVSVVLETLSDQQHEIRVCAIRALRQVAAKGDKTVALALAARVADEDPDVQVAALRALLELAHSPSDPAVLAAIREHLNHERSAVRGTALKCLRSLAKRGDPSTVSLTIGRLLDTDFMVQSEAVLTLRSLVRKGDVGVISAIRSQPQDGRLAVRAVVWWSLWEIDDKGYGSVVGGMFAAFCALIQAFVLSGVWCEADVAAPPFRPAEPSKVFWLFSMAARLASVWGLYRLSAKGFGDAVGMMVCAISVLALSMVVRG